MGTALLYVVLVLPASAQITMTMDDILPRFGEIRATTYTAENPTGLDAIVNATGGNQTYDFTAFTFDGGDSSAVDVLPLSSNIPSADDPAFENADFVLFNDPAKPPNSELNNPLYMFYSEDNEGYFLHGTVTVADLDNDGTDDTSISKNIPPLQVFAIPFTFGTTWTSSTTITTTTLGIEVSADLTSLSEVDGWGTLITPSGQAECLRLLVTNTTTVAGATTSVRALQFITKEGLAAVVAFDPLTDTPNSVLYTISAQGGDGGDGDGGGDDGGGDDGGGDDGGGDDGGGDDGGGDDDGDTTAIETVGATIPDAFELHPNYPNPFNPDTIIPFGLSEPGHVTLTVFDVLGREVATVVNEMLPAGSYTTDFRAEQLPSGVYFYKLQVKGTLLSRTMILQK